MSSGWLSVEKVREVEMRRLWSPRKKTVVRLLDPLLPWADALAGEMENWVRYDRSLPANP